MLGVALFHLLPHAAHYTHTLDHAMLWLTGGLLAMFLLIRAFHFHGHEMGSEEGHAHPHPHRDPRPRSLGWVGVAIGLSLHSLVDGIALASSALAEAPAPVAGVGTFLAVLLHKPLDSLAIASLMAASGWPARTRSIVNVAFALTCPLGAALFYVGAAAGSGAVLGPALAFAAGAFLCISLSDLLPEVQFHRHDRLKLSAALLLGVALAYTVTFLEVGFHDH
jgi:zinc and cadmium transporter